MGRLWSQISYSWMSQRRLIVQQRSEETMLELKRIIPLSWAHSMQQAARASDYTGFFYLGSLIEYDKTEYFPKMRNCNRPTIIYQVTLDRVKWQQENRIQNQFCKSRTCRFITIKRKQIASPWTLLKGVTAYRSLQDRESTLLKSH